MNSSTSSFLCDVCQELFKDPRDLPCGHTLCLECLQKLAEIAVNTGEIFCPQCEFSVSSQNVQDLPKNRTVAEFVSSLPIETQCALVGDGDEHGAAQHVCLDCWDALCQTCSEVHTKTKFTKGHTVKFLAQVTPGDIQARKQSTLFTVTCTKLRSTKCHRIAKVANASSAIRVLVLNVNYIAV
jgi:hypothetical protein